MKNRARSPLCFLITYLIILVITATVCFGHEREVHMAISISAARSSEQLTSFLGEIFGENNAPFDSAPRLISQPPAFVLGGVGFDPNGHSPLNWIQLGSYHEDDDPRYVKHFYTLLPKPVKGFTGPIGSGQPHSFAWAIANNNIESWQKAREYQYAALTSSTKATRDEKMGHCLYAIGHVLHLNQDLSQPDHVRNDAHPILAYRYIENYGVNTYLNRPNAFPLRPHGWNYWRNAGFTKLLDFWDRNKYTGNVQALNLDATSNGSDSSENLMILLPFLLTLKISLWFQVQPKKSLSIQSITVNQEIKIFRPLTLHFTRIIHPIPRSLIFSMTV